MKNLLLNQLSKVTIVFRLRTKSHRLMRKNSLKQRKNYLKKTHLKNLFQNHFWKENSGVKNIVFQTRLFLISSQNFHLWWWLPRQTLNSNQLSTNQLNWEINWIKEAKHLARMKVKQERAQEYLITSKRRVKWWKFFQLQLTSRWVRL